MVEGLQDFVQQYGIKTRGGKLILYKTVSDEWGSLWVKSHGHPGSRGYKDAYRPGTSVSSRRSDKERAHNCGRGLHVGTLACAGEFRNSRYLLSSAGFNRRIIRVLVDPEDVVCVPYEALDRSEGEYQKIRCRKLIVECEVGGYGRMKRQRAESPAQNKE